MELAGDLAARHGEVVLRGTSLARERHRRCSPHMAYHSLDLQAILAPVFAPEHRDDRLSRGIHGAAPTLPTAASQQARDL